MINRVVLVGRLTKDPEMRVSQNNIAVTTFTLAVNRPFTSKNGNNEADFISCITFRKQAENVSQYLSKGSLAGIDGRLQTRNYENKEGQRVYVTEVVCESVQFLEPKKNNQNNNNQGNHNKNQQSKPVTASDNQNKESNPFSNNPIQDIPDDDLPFWPGYSV